MKETVPKKESYFDLAVKDKIAEIDKLPISRAEKLVLLQEFLAGGEIVKQEIQEAKKSNKELSRKLKFFLKVSPAIAILVATLLIQSKKTETPVNKYEKPKELPTVSAEEQKPLVAEDTTKQIEVITPPIERFDEALYETLPTQGQEIYEYFAYENPTPGRGYMFLHKYIQGENQGSSLYIFDQDNKLIQVIDAGYGEHPGDANNTAEGGLDVRTTPSGGYILGRTSLKKDQKEYEGQLFVLNGITLKDETENAVGIHQIWGKDKKRREPIINDSDPSNNNVSKGCININEEDFKQYLEPYFNGDWTEMLFVLQDQKSKDDGNVFDVKELVKQLHAKMLSAAKKNLLIYEAAIESANADLEENAEEVNGLEAGKAQLEEIIRKAEENRNN